MGDYPHIDESKLAESSPADIDTVLAALYDEMQRFRAYLESARSYRDREAARLAKQGQATSRHLETHNAEIEKYEAKLTELRDLAVPYEAEYDSRPWNRYFLVTNTNGHVHRGMSCSTCFPTTTYRWIVDLADCDEAQMIEDYGELACTVCFPDAPSNPRYGGPGRLAEAEIAERAAKKAERDAKKAAKNLEPELQFRCVDDWPVRTVAAAKAALRRVAEVNTLAGSGQDPHGHYARLSTKGVDVAASAREALAAKGVSDDEVQRIYDRAVTKTRKDYGLLS